MILTPKNWESFQHYKDRAPAWIKLHRGLLDNYEFSRLPVASRALAPLLWLLASEYEGGKIAATLEELAFRLRMLPKEVADALNPLVQAGFFECASTVLADCKQDACLEIEEENKEEEKEAVGPKRPYTVDFENGFWKPYPRTPVMSKSEAWRAWQRLNQADQKTAIEAVPRYLAFLKSKPDHPAVHACRFLTQRRFDGFGEEEPAKVVPLTGYYAAAESEQLFAWDAYMKATTGRTLPRDTRGGWRVDAEWPPNHGGIDEQAAQERAG